MNGRIYDAKLGRFLQADPFIDQPYNTQGLNRYSYVNNNPLNAIDPSGYGIFDIVLDVIKIVVAVVVGVIGQCWECAAYIIGTLSFMQTLAAGGSFGDALLAGVSSAALTYVGGQYAPGGFDLGYTLQMATLGGITSVLQGGKFGHGFFGAGVGAASGGLKFAGTATQQLTKRVLSSAIIGGTVSRATGGKFANGAAYAAFAWAISSAANAGTPEEAANQSSIDRVNNLPDSLEKRQAIYNEGLEATKAQDLNVDQTKITPELKTIHLRNRAGMSENFTSKAAALEHLNNNPGWFAADGVHYGGGNISIYATATSSGTLLSAPRKSLLATRLKSGLHFNRRLTGVGNIVQTIAHETGHFKGLNHQNISLYNREYLAIKRYRSGQ